MPFLANLEVMSPAGVLAATTRGHRGGRRFGARPDELRPVHGLWKEYALGRRLLTQEYITNGEMEKAIEKILMRTDVDYIQVSSTTAGCYTFRIERTR